MFKGLITVAALCLPVAAHASTVSPEVTPTSYAYTVAPTNQGNLGASACGYCDDYYDGSNGELTDDVETVNFWFLTDANFQAGPNVGWEDDDPVIVFNFAEAISFDTMIMQYQDGTQQTGVAFQGVGKPDSVIVNGTQLPNITANITEWTGGDYAARGPFEATIDLTSLAPTDQLTVTVVNNSFEWTFLSEFTFTEATVAPVPIPASGLLLVAGLGAVVLGRRRRL